MEDIIDGWPFLLYSLLEGGGRLPTLSHVWDSFFKTFHMLFVCHKEVRDMIEEFLLNLPFGERSVSFVC